MNVEQLKEKEARTSALERELSELKAVKAFTQKRLNYENENPSLAKYPKALGETMAPSRLKRCQ
jgi:hypothetical protein